MSVISQPPALSAVGYFRVLSLFVRQPYEPIPAIIA